MRAFKQDVTAEDFSNAPCLGDAGASRVRFLRVEDLADGADARLAEVRLEGGEETLRFFAAIGIHLQPGVYEGSDQPAPDCALMVGSVSRAKVAVVSGFIGRFAGCE